ncbi:MAG: DUF423 domain-containing protein [Bacteriovoracaceae bacterium]|nr:DUF423 domain-containing protein [Bacteriovoracaceae bacterium]
MTLHPLAKRAFIIGTALLALGVLIGAFGAHGLKNMVEAEKLVTFETGVRYHFYHAFGILIVGILQQLFQSVRLSASLFSFLVGTLLFSFNCYLYVITGIKTFAMIVPIGGVLFVIGWVALMLKMIKLK